MRLLITCIGTILFFSIISPSFCQAFDELECKKIVASDTAEETAYKKRENDSRCEGMFDRRAGGGYSPELEIVSLVIGEVRYDLDMNEYLFVSTSAFPHGLSDRIRIRAVARDEGTNYQLDAILPQGRPFKWPLREVLYQEGLEASDIGVYAWFGEGEKRTYVPLVVTPNKGQYGKNREMSIVMVLRTPVDIEGLFWQLKAEDEEWPEPQVVYEGDLFGGQSIPLELPTREPGLLQMRVKGKSKKSDIWVRLDEVRLVIPER